MNQKNLPLVLLFVVIVLLLFFLQPNAQASKTASSNTPSLLELVKSAPVDSAPDTMIVRCEGFRCSRYHELVYWGLDNKIRFLDVNSLTETSSPLSTSMSAFAGSRYLFYDQYYQQIYALDRSDEGSYPNSWYRIEARIIRGYDYAATVPINEDLNTPTPVDKYYHIDGAALQQPVVNSGSIAKIFVDNPVNGNVDMVSFHGHAPDAAQASRFSYRAPLSCASANTCSWHENPGSSLAVDEASNVYIADNNDFDDKIWVHRANGTPKASIENLGDLFPCYVDEAGITMAPQEDVLYLPADCQSFADGAIARLDITGANNHQVTALPYKDQDFAVVDWFDQKRAFVATADFAGEYDPMKRLYIHLLYDGQLIATLPVMSNYERGSLNAMVFDPIANKLYLAVKNMIYVVDVNYGGSAGFPPLPEGGVLVTPDAVHELRAQDSSAVFRFVVGSVDDDTQVVYKELPPTAVPGTTTQAVQTVVGDSGTVLYAMRQFELTAVPTSTSTPLTSFNQSYQLKLYYSPQEIAPIIGGNNNVALYYWNGSSWQETGSTNGSSSENLLYIYANQTGRFAIFGATNSVYLPIISGD